MAGLARSPRDNRTIVIRVKDKHEFIKNFNNSMPSEDMRRKMKKAGKIFGIE
jgi:hypothetical protein